MNIRIKIKLENIFKCIFDLAISIVFFKFSSDIDSFKQSVYRGDVFVNAFKTLGILFIFVTIFDILYVERSQKNE